MDDVKWKRKNGADNAYRGRAMASVKPNKVVGGYDLHVRDESGHWIKKGNFTDRKEACTIGVQTLWGQRTKVQT